MKKLFFNIRPNSRERMWDTVKQATNCCNVVLPNVQQQSSITIHKKKKFSFVSKLKNLISNNSNLLNEQKIANDKDSDLLYLWGSFPKNTTKNFIIELDNPYSLTYYNKYSFNKNIEKIKARLRKAKGITYLSEASKNHTLELLGKEFESKSRVSYPFMNRNYKKNSRKTDVINFIFVGLNGRGKGADELLEAFIAIDNEKIRLTFISDLSDDKIIQYQKDTRITILPPQTREKLLNEIYPKMDVMVFPSFYESFGVVLLEALSYGMGIITVNTYATPEIVKSNYNGKLLHHPIIKPSKLNDISIINCVDFRNKEFYKRYLENNEFYYSLYSELKQSIEEAEKKYKSWQKNSVILFDEKFSPEVWIDNFSGIIEK